jgi:hypothetical protein
MKIEIPKFTVLLALFCSSSALAGSDSKNVTSQGSAAVEQPSFKLASEFDIEQAFVGDGEVQRNHRTVDDLDEYYSRVHFVLTPRIRAGILRLGAEWERFSFGYSNGQQLPNTLQSVSAIVGLDTQFSDSFLFRIEAQPGFYGTSFEHLGSDNFIVPVVIGGTYIYSPELQFVLGVAINYEQKYPVLPGGGVRWKFAPKWTLNAVAPAPRLEYEACRSVTLFAGANIKASTFRTDDRFGDARGDGRLNNALVTYSEVRVGAGFEWKVSSSCKLTVEGGYQPYRNFDFYRPSVRYHSEEGAPYGAIALHGAF